MRFFELAAGFVGLFLLLSRVTRCQGRTHAGMEDTEEEGVEHEAGIDINDGLNADARIHTLIEKMVNFCPRIRRDGERIYREFLGCIESNLIPPGRRGQKESALVQDICTKWPKIGGCMKNALDIIDECWINRHTVTKILNSIVDFGCGENNDGARFLEFHTTGPACLKEPDIVKELLTCTSNSSFFVDPTKRLTFDVVCRVISQAHECAHRGLMKCEDRRPEELVSSMMKTVASSLSCPLQHGLTGSGSYLFTPLLLMIAGTVAVNALQ